MPNFQSFPEAVQQIPSFAAFVEEGSRVLHEPQQPGLSAHHVYVVTKDMSQSTQERIAETLTAYPLGDEFTVAHRSYDDFVTGIEPRDLSMKFRARTIFGQDVIAEKRTISRELALQIGRAGLANLDAPFRDKLLNTANWSIDHVRAEVYGQLKSFFDSASAAYYGIGEEYPQIREHVVNYMPNSSTGRHILDVMYSAEEASFRDCQAALYLSSSMLEQMLAQLPADTNR